MKTVLFAAALLVGTAAIAQEYPETVPPDATTDMPDVSTPLTTPEAPMTTTMTPTSDSWAASTGTTVAPDNSNPEHDARGIAVISDPAVVPAGFNGTVGAAVGGPLEPVAADASYPPCSRTITDNCTQTYERGLSPN
jgi:hypothetical protein